MNEMLKMITEALLPLLCLLISTGVLYLVALIRKKTAQIQNQIDNDTADKYIGMASEAVVQAVTYTAQTFVDTLKHENAFTIEKQLEAFDMAKEKTFEIIGVTAVEALNEIYGDYDAWITTKIEQACREIKMPIIELDASEVIEK